MSIRRYYYWIITRDETGKPYLVFGSDRDEDDARQKGMELLGGTDFEIKRLPTRDLASASRMLKGNRLEQTHSLREAGRRVGHTKSLARQRVKRMSQKYLEYSY